MPATVPETPGPVSSTAWAGVRALFLLQEELQGGLWEAWDYQKALLFCSGSRGIKLTSVNSVFPKSTPASRCPCGEAGEPPEMPLRWECVCSELRNEVVRALSASASGKAQGGDA